ncbi:ATP-binding protein [Ascidiaceihabitans sp.]|uniref:YobI family P-loop NTPase n=1 Tax=Ascidiaceihabitans sp. TaxID=1872644 RepID=UPI003296C960
MNAFVIVLVHWFAKRLSSLAAFLENIGRSAETQSKFVNLAPTDDADEAGVYTEAINFAINDTKVKNIALTGPYGSGKSSIIQSFLNRHRPKALHISLAAFIPDEDAVTRDKTRQEIERSILQQMLYGADANRLPLSRFKRIQSPSVWSIFTSLYLVLGIASLWYVFHHRESVFSGTFFEPFAFSNWINLGIFTTASVFLWTAFHHFYVASFGVSLKSVSLKDIEIRPAADDQDSILNRYLDEIIYFFQSTAYDLVIIEDLDRFNDAEIFTTLREINSLVNENAGVKRTIRFLYTLRDDMFSNTDRTKFFEFIIPVIPIINSSNSIDMVLEQGKRLALDKRLDRQFLREVSRYLNDLRLIQNIFNEYTIYVSNLETDEENLLNANKLLAVLIYKNVHPKDFEKLHRDDGNFAQILNHREALIRSGEATYRDEIAELEQQIQTAERQTPSDLKELRRIYAMALIELLPAGTMGIRVEGQTVVPLAELSEHNAFEQLIEATRINYRNQHNQNMQTHIHNVQDRVDAEKSYQQRKAEIAGKASENKNNSLRKISELKSKIATLRTTKLNELLRLNASGNGQLFDRFKENVELARFLILEGHLDDTYYQYTSLFHSGRLSPNDNRFLIQIRAFVTPAPDFPIDNPREVIAAMRDEDFGQSYILNVKLVDCLLSDPSSYPEQVRKFVDFISTDFGRCEGFLDVYYASGNQVTELLSRLSAAWKGLVPAIMESAKGIKHVAELVAGLPRDALVNLAREFDKLPDFVAGNLPTILAHFPELEPNRLQGLNFEVKDLAAIEGHPYVLNAMWENGLFELTIANFEYAYSSILGENDMQPLREKNFTTIRGLKTPILLNRAEQEFDRYMHDVVLKLPENSMENEQAILDVVRRETISQDILSKFLEQQYKQLPSLDGVPESLHSILFELSSIEPSWANCLSFLEGSGFDAERLIEYLERDEVRSTILKEPIPDDSEAKNLRLFLVTAGSLSDVAYTDYARALPRQFQVVPKELEQSKIRILIEEQKLEFSTKVLEALSDYRDLQVQFVAINVEAYIAASGDFALDDDFREQLLRSGVDLAAKREIVKLMDLPALVGLPERAALIGPIIDSSDASLFDLNADVVQTLIDGSKSITTQISLLNKCHALLTIEEVRAVLAKLPRPYSEIKTGYGIPRLKNQPENLDLVNWLDSRDIISSWSEGRLFSNDIRVNLYRS